MKAVRADPKIIPRRLTSLLQPLAIFLPVSQLSIAVNTDMRNKFLQTAFNVSHKLKLKL
jgi:hypothetical protein